MPHDMSFDVNQPNAQQRSTAAALLIGTLVLGFACVTPATAHATQDTVGVRNVVDSAIRPLMARHDISGMTVGIILGDQTFFFNYGVTSKENGSPVSTSTLFEIGSVSKVLTATLAAYAEATGKLSLGDHPSRYLPTLKDTPVDRATLLQLGTYTAGGLPLQFPDTVAGKAGAMSYLRNWQPSASPGTMRLYSNPSPGLLGLATASALNGEFAALMQSLVFRALGMSESFIHVPDSRMSYYAWGHRGDRLVRVNQGPLDEEAYGVKTTVSDLTRFIQANIDPTSLEPEMRRAVQITQTGYFRAGPMVQGLGWEYYPYPVSREWLLGGNSAEMLFEPQPAHRMTDQSADEPLLFNKTGSTGGFATYVAFVPSRRIGIVMLANRSYPIPDRVGTAWTILEYLASQADWNGTTGNR